MAVGRCCPSAASLNVLLMPKASVMQDSVVGLVDHVGVHVEHLASRCAG